MEMNRAELAAVDGVAGDLLDGCGRLLITPNPVTVDGQRNVPADLRPDETLDAFLRRHVPGIESGAWTVMIGGATIPRTMWSRTRPKHGQLIACRASVGKQVVQLAAIAALSYFTMGMGGIAGGAFMGLKGAIGFAAAMGSFVAGSVLINKVLGPKVPKMGEAAAARQVHSLTSQRNSPRPYESMPTLWGEMRVTPDLAGQPYAWFEGDDQYLSTILLGGVNVHSVVDLAIGDTPISSFTDATVFYNGFSGMPSQDVPLYGNADSIAGGELENNGGWVMRTSSAGTIALQVDIEGQLYDVSGDKFLANSVPLFIETRPVGAGEWRTAVNETLSNAASDLMRRTFTVPVAQGQHEVRVRIGKPLWDEGEGKDACKLSWSVLKSIQPDTTEYSGWGRIGIKIKATGQISGSLDTLRATYRAKPLLLWNGAEWVTATTRAEGLSNPGAILLQTLRGVYGPDPITGERVLQFGFGMSDEQIDIEGLKAFMLHCAARGYTYDRWITGSMSLGQFCEEVALAGMGEFSWTDGSRPTAVFVSSGQPLSGVVNMANMLKGSFSVAYNLANAADGIEYQYLDRDRNWETQTLRVAAPGETTMLNPARITGEGVTTEAHAAVLARYHLAQSLFQYKTISFGADIEHLSYRRLSVLSVSHDLTQWGYGGRVMSAGLNAAGKVVLQLDEPVPPMAQAYVGLRVPGARGYRVFRVEALEAESDWISLVEPWPAGVKFPGQDLNNPAHDTLWCYDFKATPGYRVRVVGMQPEADLKGAQVTCVPEGPEFWDYVLNGNYTPAPNESSLALGRPKVSNLRITEKVNVQGDTEWYSLSLTWDVEGEYDHAQVWAGRDGSELLLVDGNVMGSRAEFRIDGAGEWLIEVRPFNSSGQLGEYATVLYTTGITQLPPRNVDTFAVHLMAGELRRFVWTYAGDQRPLNFAGVQIRYAPGNVALSVADWDNLTPIGTAEDIYTAALETTRPEAGTWTFACRAINTAGQLANGVRTVAATLQAPFAELTDTIAEVTHGLDDTLDLIRGEVSDRVNADTRETLERVQADADEKAARVRELAEAAAANAQKLAEERNARAQEISAAASQLQQQIQTLQAQIGDVLGAEEYAADQAYAVGDLVVFGEKLYRALQANVGVVPTDAAYWQLIGDYASIADAVVAQAAQISEASSRITQVGADVTALSAAQTSLAGRLTTAEGNLSAQSGALASLQQTVSSQGGTLSANSNAITALTNKIASRPNLLPNGSFERGIRGWSEIAVTGGVSDWITGNDAAWGFRALRFGFSADNITTGALQSDPFPVRATVVYAVAGDTLILNAIAGQVGFDLYFLDSLGNPVLGGDGPNNLTAVWHDFSVSDHYRNLHAVEFQAPAGATQARARFLFEGIRGGADCVIGCRQIKVEAGGLPVTPYSLEGSLAAESAAASVLEGRVAVNEAGLTSASQSLVSLDNRVGAAESQDSAHSGAISGLQGSVSSINGALSSQNSLISSLQGSVSSLQNGKADAGALSILENRVHVAEGIVDSTSRSLDSLTNRVTGAEGVNSAQGGVLSGLQSDVSSINGALSSHTSQLSNLQGSVSSLQAGKADAGALQSLDTRVGAAEANLSSTSTALTALTNKIVSRPNRLPNGSFERGLEGWSQQGGGVWLLGNDSAWGFRALRYGFNTANATTGTLESDPFPVRVAMEYIIAGDSVLLGAISGSVGFDMQFLDGNGSTVPGGDGPNNMVSASHDFSVSDHYRNLHAVAYAAPPGAVQARARFIFEGIRGGADCVVGCRQIKVEAGGLPETPYSMEAELALEAAATRTLESKVAATESGLSSASSSLTSLANRIGAAESQGAAQSGAISGLQSETSSINGALSSHTSQIASLQGSVSSLQAGKADAGALSSLEGRVSATEGGLQSASTSLTSLTNRVVDAEGVNSGQAGAISGLQSSVSSINGALSSQTSQLTHLQAQLANRPNLLPYGGFEAGSKGWRADGWSIGNTSTWGMSALRFNASGTFSLDSDPFDLAGPAPYVITADTLLLNATAGAVYVDLQYFAADGRLLKDGLQKPVSTLHDFSTGNEMREAHAVSDDAPPGTAFAIARFVAFGIQGPNAIVGCRMVKVERGGLPATGNSSEATAAAEAVAFSSLSAKVTQAEGNITSQASQVTGLSSTVAGHTSSINQQASTLASLNGQIQSTWVLNVTAGGKVAGMAFRNDGTTRDLVFLTDRFAVATNDTGPGQYPFVLGNVGGVPTAAFNANLNVDGGILTRHLGAQQVTADKLRVTQLSAVTADMGDVRAGLVHNSDNSTYLNLNAQGTDIAFQIGGGRFHARANGYVEADRINIRRRDVLATGTAFWGHMWRAGDAHDPGIFVIDTLIDDPQGVDFSINQPFHAVVTFSSGPVQFYNLGNEKAFDLVCDCSVALTASHYSQSSSVPYVSPRLQIVVRPLVRNAHERVASIALNYFTWSLFRA